MIDGLVSFFLQQVTDSFPEIDEQIFFLRGGGFPLRVFVVLCWENGSKQRCVSCARGADKVESPQAAAPPRRLEAAREFQGSVRRSLGKTRQS